MLSTYSLSGAWAPEPAALSTSSLRALVDAVDIGLLVCDVGAQLLHANACADRMLRHGTPLGLLPGRRLGLPGRGDQANAELHRAMADAAGGRHRLLLLGEAGESVPLALQPLPASSGNPAQQVLLMLGRRTPAPDLALAMLCRLHALTDAEQRVLRGLLRGQRVTELAQAFGVKVSTVRTQVASLREKLGVHCMDDLLLMVAELPPMASALRSHRGTGAVDQPLLSLQAA